MKKVLVILFFALVTAGCLSSGGSSSSGSGGGDSASGGSGSGGGNAPIGHTPEPATMAMLGIGLSGLAFAKLRKKNKKS